MSKQQIDPVTAARNAVMAIINNGDRPANRIKAELAALNSILIARALDRLTDAVKSMDRTIHTAGLPDGHPDKIV